MSWKDTVCDVMKVPPEPEPPPGSPPRVFRAAPNYFYLLLVRWGIGAFAMLILAIVVTGLALGASAGAPPPVVVLLGLVAAVVWLFVVIQVLFGYAVVRLNWEMRWYMISDRAIRIREGIWSVREKTIALANIQNISVRQGPLERLLGIADVEVRTAGGGGGGPRQGQHGGHQGVGEPMHIGFFRGVDNAEEIRDVVRTGVRRYRDTGLGDHDDHDDHDGSEEAESHSSSSMEEAARLLHEARLLRSALERSVPPSE